MIFLHSLSIARKRPWPECCSVDRHSPRAASRMSGRDYRLQRNGHMRATIIILTLLLASTAHAQSACREYQQELERARTLYYRSGREAGAEVTSLTSLQDACKAELRMA